MVEGGTRRGWRRWGQQQRGPGAVLAPSQRAASLLAARASSGLLLELISCSVTIDSIPLTKEGLMIEVSPQAIEAIKTFLAKESIESPLRIYYKTGG